jgi:hypothetical protein
MIAEKCPPALGRRVSSPDHLLGHAGLSDIGAELEQLSMDPRRFPQRIGNIRTVGRPPPRREFQLQYYLNPARCHFMTVSGFPTARAVRTVAAKRYNPTTIKRSAVLKVCLFGEFRRSTLIWCRRPELGRQRST